MDNIQDYIISSQATVKDAMHKLNEAKSSTLFVVDSNNKVLAAVTDGDIRRYILKSFPLDSNVLKAGCSDFRYLKHPIDTDLVKILKKKGIVELPLLDEENRILKIVDLNLIRTILPLQAVIMAGGKGSRLMPLTKNTPKPLLKVGDKPIIEYNIDRLNDYGISTLHISVNYLAEQLVDAFGDGSQKKMKIEYLYEKEPRGTIGALSEIESYNQSAVIVMNSDLLTNIDFEDLYKTFKENDAAMVVATVPYEVKIPYGVVETENNLVKSLKEKPTYTYYSNAGIYIISLKALELIPESGHFNATDLIEELLKRGDKVVNFPIVSYWLDIGKHDDYKKANEDIKHIKL